MSIKKVLTIARWEYVEKVRTKAFIISLIVTPTFIIVMSVLPGLFMTKSDESTIMVGIIDSTGVVAPALNSDLTEKYKLPDGRPNYRVVTIAPGKDARAEASKLVMQGQISSYIVVDSSIFGSRKFKYVSQNVSNFKEIERLQSAVKDIVVSSQLQQRGVNPDLVKEVSKPVDMETVKLSKTGHEEKAGAVSSFFMGYIFIMVLALSMLMSGQLLVRSVVEEKTNRIVEVLVSSVSADEIMAGKVFGLSLLGLTQLTVWALIGGAFAGQMASFLTVPDNVWWVLIFFILGFLFYSTLFVMAGAPVTTEQEAQQAMTYVSMLLFFPIVFATLIIQDPTAVYIKVLSLIPFFTPAMMAFRISVQSPDTWELVVSALILLASTYFCMIAAGRIFRIGILVYGKRPRLKELMRWALKKS